MNPNDQRRWKDQVLEFALAAFAAHEPLRSALIFKGARLLNLRLGDTGSRESFDLDSNLDMHCASAHPDTAARRGFLERESELALRRLIARQDPARFSFKSVKVEVKPPRDDHPFNWTGFTVKIGLLDNANPAAQNTPAVEIDIAAPEVLGEGVISALRLRDGLTVQAYTLERIAGEKLRAYLTSLPAYRTKVGRRPDTPRFKDLYDLARIRRRYAIADNAFWRTAGREFHLACESRFVDCAGIATFGEDLDTSRQQYETEPTLPKDIPFNEAWAAVQAAVDLFTGLGILPFAFPIPEGRFQPRYRPESPGLHKESADRGTP
ncbi:MAG: nucleotidyl transferase AbiEii/AbiGii toxin family protein [Kiritimatiellae bacterium]|jgi:hypothetical protein|nr:nucleotidyl transferase AbiEii/AbiGii toxin family protein [Kiritimatiellia bacterium]